MYRGASLRHVRRDRSAGDLSPMGERERLRRKQVKKGITLAAIAIAAVLLTVGFAAAAGGPRLSTFGSGDVFVNGAKFATFNDAGEYGGVYRNHTSNVLLSDSRIDLEFVNDRAVGGGAPRFSIPIDENNDKRVEAYAFIDVNSCGGASLVSTESATCGVYYKDQAAPYANWSAFAAAHPTWRLARKDGTDTTMPFVVADVQGDYLVHGIVLSY
jgi:hypothetical protein